MCCWFDTENAACLQQSPDVLCTEITEVFESGGQTLFGPPSPLLLRYTKWSPLHAIFLMVVVIVLVAVVVVVVVAVVVVAVIVGFVAVVNSSANEAVRVLTRVTQITTATHRDL